MKTVVTWERTLEGLRVVAQITEFDYMRVTDRMDRTDRYVLDALTQQNTAASVLSAAAMLFDERKP